MPNQTTAVVKEEATAEPMNSSLDVTCLKRSSVGLAATETHNQPGSLCSKNDGRRSSSYNGYENVDSSMEYF